MVWVTMSERELQRIEVLAQVVDKRLSVDAAANVLVMSRRQVFRLLKSFRHDGALAVRHKARGRPPNNRIKDARRDYALALIREHYADFGPTLAAEMLVKHHAFSVSRETLRRWMTAVGIWLPRKHRRKFHQPRLRRECLGELIQIDGSEHRWFEDRGPPCTLLVFIDDATSTLMELRFVPSESTASYFEALRSYLQSHGRPVAFYSDKHTVFRAARSGSQNGNGMTQFSRALSELNMEILCANSSEAKGRVERANRTLQDRLVKELRLAGINDIDAANAYLPGFMAVFNEQFAKRPAKPDNLHRPLNTPTDRLDDILCWREKRHVGKQLTITFERQRIILAETDQSHDLPGQYVDTYTFPDGRFQVRWKGQILPYTVFDKDQRVTQADIVENKRLGEVLAHIKERQEQLPPTPKIKTNSEKQGYAPRAKKQPRKPRRTDFEMQRDRQRKLSRAGAR